MRITPPSSPLANDPLDTVVLHAPKQLPTPAQLSSPEGRVMTLYVDELLSMLGVHSVGFNRVTNPGELRISIENYDFAKLVDNTLRDAVFGVKLVLTAVDGTPYDMSAPGSAWTSRPSSSARLIASMPGVVSFMNLGDAIVYSVESTRVRDELKALTEERPNGLLTIWNFEHRIPA